jgi:dihydroxy-acid dehydratase
MLNGYDKGSLSGSGMVIWKGRELLSAGEITRDEFVDYVATG